MTLKAAHMMDTVGNKAARREIAMIKVVAPAMACTVIDRAIQVFGAAGVSQDTFLAEAYAKAALAPPRRRPRRGAPRGDRTHGAGAV